MRLSDVLSKQPDANFVQVEGFLQKRLMRNKQGKINIGSIGCNYYCKHCRAIRTFLHSEEIFCIGVSNNMISIDCVLKCPTCNELIQKWFLVESSGDMHDFMPWVRIIKQSERMSENVLINDCLILGIEGLLDKAEHAYYENLGAGAFVYLRKIYELITVQMAVASNINTKKDNGRRKHFKDLLQEVDNVKHIIPQEFTNNGYKLFSDLSDVLHAAYDECIALEKYKDLKRLICGILDNIKNNQELNDAIMRLGWNGGDNVQN